MLEDYSHLALWDDVQPALEELVYSVFFSNGSKSQLKKALVGNGRLKEHSQLFRQLVTVEQARLYKPAPQVYKLLWTEVNEALGSTNFDCWLVSSNPFDVVGAKSYGMRAVWVDREGNGWIDELGGFKGRPDVVVGKLGEVAEAVLEFVQTESS